MAFNKAKLEKDGNINLFQLEGTHNYVMVIAFTDVHFLASLVNTGKGYTTYISSDYEEDDYLNIEDLMGSVKKYYKTLPDFSHCMYKKAPATASKIVKSFVQGTGLNKASDEVLFKILQDEGYDITGLSKTICVVSDKRDYSDLTTTNPEAKANVEQNEKDLKIMGATMAGASVGAQRIYEALVQGKKRAVLFTGPAGTGKSVLATTMATAMGAPLLRYQATEGTQIEDLKGEYIPSADKDKQFEYCLGLLLKAYAEGYQMLIDEVNMAPAGVLSLLNQFLDDTPNITIYGTVYKRHPNFVLYCTMNPGYEGTNALNASLKSRFICHEVPRLTEQKFVERMVNFSKRFCGNPLSVDFYKKLYNYGQHIAGFASQWGENVEICIRNAQDLTSLILTKPCTREEFFESVANSYLSFLSIDNDNYEKIENLKKTEDEVKMIDDLYSQYDFREIVSVEVKNSYKDSTVEATTTSSSKKHSHLDAEDMDILDGFDEATDFDDLVETKTTKDEDADETESSDEEVELDSDDDNSEENED